MSKQHYCGIPCRLYGGVSEDGTNPYWWLAPECGLSVLEYLHEHIIVKSKCPTWGHSHGLVWHVLAESLESYLFRRRHTCWLVVELRVDAESAATNSQWVFQTSVVDVTFLLLIDAFVVFNACYAVRRCFPLLL
jgi:hypothetical protein